MEFFLNICWLMIALGAFSLWLAGLRVRKRVEAPRIRMEAVALACVVVLLLFPISMTDDLHPEVFLAACVFCHRRDCPHLLASNMFDPSSAGHGGLVIPIRPVAWPSLLVLSILVLRSIAPPKTVKISNPLGRSPPWLRA